MAGESMNDVGTIQMADLKRTGHRINNQGPSAADAGTQMEEARGRELDMLNLEKWSKPIAAMAFAALFVLFGIYSTTNGNLMPKHPIMLDILLGSLAVAFFAANNGTLIKESLRGMAKALFIAALVSINLSFTMVLWTLLSPSLGWAPWVLFVVTLFAILGVLVYEWGLRAFKSSRIHEV